MDPVGGIAVSTMPRRRQQFFPHHQVARRPVGHNLARHDLGRATGRYGTSVQRYRHRLLAPIGYVPPAEFEADDHPKEDPSHTAGLKPRAFAEPGAAHPRCCRCARLGRYRRRAWRRTASLADTANTDGEFVALRGFESSHLLGGHMNLWASQRVTDPLRSFWPDPQCMARTCSHRRALRSRDQPSTQDIGAPPAHHGPERAGGSRTVPPRSSRTAAGPPSRRASMNPGSGHADRPLEVAAPIEVGGHLRSSQLVQGDAVTAGCPKRTARPMGDLQGLLLFPATGRQRNQGGARSATRYTRIGRSP